MRLAKGERIVEVLKQGRSAPVRVELQVAIIYAVINDMLEDVPIERIQEYEAVLYDYIENKAYDIIDEINKTGALSDETEQKIRNAIEECKKSFKE
jgi:F-type H+-transporting ATPase subunit alpha